MTENDIVGLVMFAVMAGAGLMLIWMARAAASGKLKRNSVAGIRTRKTMASEEAWRAAHVRAKKPTLLAGVVSLVGGLVALLLAGTTAIAITVAVVSFIGGVIALLPIGMGAIMFAVMVATGVTFALVVYGAIIGGRAADEVTPPEEYSR